MKKLLDAELSMQTIKLRQLGGIVKVINSKMCYVKFEVAGFKVAYAYNVNKKGKYFLERIAPYPLPLKEFDAEQDVVDIILIDLEQFRNAVKSHNIQDFVDINRQLSQAQKKFEDLFLYYDVSQDVTRQMQQKIDDIKEIILSTKRDAKRLYHKKNPEFL